MMNRTTIQEQLSALADGQLQGDELTAVVGALRTRDDLQVAWRDWHLVGEVLRTGTHSPCSETSRFVGRLRERLAQEPSPAQPSLPPLERPVPVQVVRAEAANAPVFRWKLVAGAASIAAATAIGWNWVGGMAGTSPASAGPQLALQQVQPAVVSGAAGAPGAAGPVLAVAGGPAAPGGGLATAGATRVVVGNGAPQVMLRDPRLDELLAAHQQAGGASQMPSGFLRNATFEEGPSR